MCLRGYSTLIKKYLKNDSNASETTKLNNFFLLSCFVINVNMYSESEVLFFSPIHFYLNLDCFFNNSVSCTNNSLWLTSINGIVIFLSVSIISDSNFGFRAN